jgi:hypothetical protein
MGGVPDRSGGTPATHGQAGWGRGEETEMPIRGPATAWLATGALALSGVACAAPEDEIEQPAYTGEDDPVDPVVQDGREGVEAEFESPPEADPDDPEEMEPAAEDD